MSTAAIARFNEAATELQETEFRRPRTPNEWQQISRNPPPSDYTKLFNAVLPLLEAFREMDSEPRLRVGPSLNPDALGTLRQFAHTMSLLAVRRSSRELIEEGLTASAVLGETDDPRDLCFYLATLYHSARRLGLDTQTLFARVACMISSAYFQKAMRNFPLRPPESRELSAFRLHEVLTDHGYDFIQDSFDRGVTSRHASPHLSLSGGWRRFRDLFRIG